MRVFRNSWFRKFARKQRLSDAALCEAVARVEAGLIDADLGGGLLKQRVGREGGGRSGGYRTLLAFKAQERAVFVFGFAKSEQDNIGLEDERELKKLAKLVLAFAEEEIDRLVAAGKFDEVRCDGEGSEDLPK
jgi:hypothetical protein